MQTARGSVDTAELGTTLMHEHIFVLSPDSQQQWQRDWDEEARVADAVSRLRELAGTGVRTIVDPTVDGLGRDIPRIVRIAEQVPELNIVVATGVYTYADVPGYFSSRGPGALPDLPEPMVDLFVRDIEVGIAETNSVSLAAGLASADKRSPPRSSRSASAPAARRRSRR